LGGVDEISQKETPLNMTNGCGGDSQVLSNDYQSDSMGVSGSRLNYYPLTTGRKTN